ncbi:hypothetical protein BD560DRAFT_389840 [Blakeslea trispora]|nr:hypothetical protein BD560DRAFT_389840 [Blakeslea trispora]
MSNATTESCRLYTRAIKTSLPNRLQYLQAAALPLGPKTRKAHILWSIKFSQVINKTFRGEIYQMLMKRSEFYKNATNITVLLASIEETITLGTEEESIDIHRTLSQYDHSTD